jgi:hypothetical protein
LVHGRRRKKVGKKGEKGEKGKEEKKTFGLDACYNTA